MASEPDLLLQDPWSLVGMMSHRDEQFVMRDDESLTELLAALNAQTAETLRLFAEPTSTRRLSYPTTFTPFMKILTGQCAGC